MEVKHIKIDYDDNIFCIIDKINEALKHTGIEFVFSNKEYDGYEILYLVEKEQNNGE